MALYACMENHGMEAYLQQQMESLSMAPGRAALSDCGTNRAATAASGAVVGGSATDEISERAAQELKHMVKKWSEVDANIRNISRVLQGWKGLKQDYEQKITGFMRENDLEGLNTQQGLIQCRVTQRKKRVTKASMRDVFDANIADPELRRRMIKLVCEGPEEKGDAKTTLKRFALG